MSTRAQIEFVVKWNNKDNKPERECRTIYRHSDGYPEGVIPDLKKFLKWNAGRNTDVEYAAANFIYWSKRGYEEKYFKPGETFYETKSKWSDVGPTNCSQLHTGFGVCNNKELHGDIAYFYRVIASLEDKDKDNIIIECYTVGYGNEYEVVVAQKPKITKVKVVEV
jgi:hypothetical protein